MPFIHSYKAGGLGGAGGAPAGGLGCGGGLSLLVLAGGFGGFFPCLGGAFGVGGALCGFATGGGGAGCLGGGGNWPITDNDHSIAKRQKKYFIQVVISDLIF